MSGTAAPAVTFDYSTWRGMFSELASVTSAQAAGLVTRAQTQPMVARVLGSAMQPTQQLALLNLAVAHLAKLNVPINGDLPSDLVGRVSSAGEGSVSVSADVGTSQTGSGFWSQTRYGFEFWQATASLRTAVFVPGFNPRCSVPGWYGGYGRC